MPGPSASAPRTSISSTAARARTRCRETPSRRLGTGGLRGRTTSDVDGVEVVTRPGFEQVLFVEMGWGADQHGQNATKACVRAAQRDRSTAVWTSTREPVILRIVASPRVNLYAIIASGTPSPRS